MRCKNELSQKKERLLGLSVELSIILRRLVTVLLVQ